MKPMQSGFIDVPIDDFNRSVRAMVDNLPGDLMAHNTRAGERDFSFHDMEIGMADTASCTSLITPCQMNILGIRLSS